MADGTDCCETEDSEWDTCAMCGSTSDGEGHRQEDGQFICSSCEGELGEMQDEWASANGYVECGCCHEITATEDDPECVETGEHVCVNCQDACC